MTYEEVLKQYEQEKTRQRQSRETIEKKAVSTLKRKSPKSWDMDSLIGEIQKMVEEPDTVIMSVIWQLIDEQRLALKSDNTLVAVS